MSFAAVNDNCASELEEHRRKRTLAAEGETPSVSRLISFGARRRRQERMPAIVGVLADDNWMILVGAERRRFAPADYPEDCDDLDLGRLFDGLGSFFGAAP